MLLIFAVAVALALVPPFRGRYRGLGSLRFRHMWLVLGAYGLQTIAVAQWRWVPDGGRGVINLSSYAIAFGFLWLNRRIPGMAVLAAGAALNALVIGLNGGVLPASARALVAAGLPTHAARFTNSTVLAHPRLGFLGDVFWVPKGVPFSNVFSVGDALIAAGAFAVVHLATGSRLFSRRRPADAAPERA